MVEQWQEFQRQPEAIEAKVTGLFAMVADGLPGATYALVSGNSEVLELLGEREQVIDALYREIDELASREILLQAPVASDLRAIADRLDQHQPPAALIVWVGLLGYRRSGNVVPDFDKHLSAIGGLAARPRPATCGVPERSIGCWQRDDYRVRNCRESRRR